MLWLFRRAGSALAGAFLVVAAEAGVGGPCFSTCPSFLMGLLEVALLSPAGAALASAVAWGALVSGLGLPAPFPLASMLVVLPGVWDGQ